MPEGRPIVSDMDRSLIVSQYIDAFVTPLSTRHIYLKNTSDFLLIKLEMLLQ